MWLGRALGEKANKASFLSAFSLGKRVRKEFEEAVRLSPRNAEALADLGEFYHSAPGVVGGGADKAEGVAAQLDKADPVRAHELRGRMAEDRKDYGAAEREFKQAVATSPRPAFQWTTLAAFYRVVSAGRKWRPPYAVAPVQRIATNAQAWRFTMGPRYLSGRTGTWPWLPKCSSPIWLALSKPRRHRHSSHIRGWRG